MSTRGPASFLGLVVKGEQVLLRQVARLEPGREQRLSVTAAVP